MADNEKLIIGGTTFFLGGDQEREDATLEDSDEDEGVDLSKIRHQINKNKKSKKKENELRKAAATVRKVYTVTPQFSLTTAALKLFYYRKNVRRTNLIRLISRLYISCATLRVLQKNCLQRIYSR